MAEFVFHLLLNHLSKHVVKQLYQLFKRADFANDPGAAFSEGMSAAMDFMADAGMPPDMMEMMQDFCSRCI